MIQDEKPAAQISVSDIILMRLGAVDKNIDELGKRMDRLEKRMDKLEEKLDKQDEKFEKLADRIDKLASKIDSSSNHGQIATISTIAIVSAVIYTLFNALYSLIK